MSLAAALQYLGNPVHTILGVRLLRLLGEEAVDASGRSLGGEVILVTGGTAGIGRATAVCLRRLGAEVHITGRNSAQGAAMEKEHGVHFHAVDHSSVHATRTFALAFIEHVLEGRPLDCLVNNAAAMLNTLSMTPEGHEGAVALNLLSMYALTTALAPSLARAPAGRCVVVVSAGHHLYRLSPAALRNLCDGAAPWNTHYDSIQAYSLTHRARVLLTQHWAETHPDVFWASVHPGWVATPGLRSANAMRGFRWVTGPLLRDEEAGADTVLWLAAGLQPPHVASGSFLWDRRARPVDLRAAGTRATPDEVRKLVDFCAQRVAAACHPDECTP